MPEQFLAVWIELPWQLAAWRYPASQLTSPVEMQAPEMSPDCLVSFALTNSTRHPRVFRIRHPSALGRPCYQPRGSLCSCLFFFFDRRWCHAWCDRSWVEESSTWQVTLLKAQIAEEAAEFAKVGLGSSRQKSSFSHRSWRVFSEHLLFHPVVGRCQVQNLYKSELQEAMKA